MSSGFNLFKNWTDISPNQTGQFVTIDVAGLVPDNATGVILRLSNQWYKSQACVRRIGSSVNPDWYQLTWKGHTFAFCGLVNLQFEAYCKSLAYYSFEGNPVKIYLCGYTDEAVGFLPEPVQTNDCSSLVPADATGGIWLVYSSHPTTGRSFGIRGYGSTDKHYYDSDLYGGHATHIVSIDSEANSFIYALIAFGEGKKISFTDIAHDGYVKPYLIGYTRPPVHFFLNSILKEPPANGWQRLQAPELPPEADGVIVEIRNTAPGRKKLSIRAPGSSNSAGYLGLETAIWGVCGVENGEFEAYADWAARAMFFIHGYTTPAGTPQVFPCPHCSETFPTQEELNQHILDEHTFPCPYCSRTFTTQAELDNHIESEHTFLCPHCAEVFTSQADLDAHIQQNHHFPCPYCDEVFVTQQELDDHIASAHPKPGISIAIQSGTLEGTATITDSHISMDITLGHIEGEIS